jgi:hypothetical protein
MSGNGLSGAILGLTLVLAGWGVVHAVALQRGIGLAENQELEVVGKLKSVELAPGFIFDNSVMILEDGTRVLVRGAYPMYRPGEDVVKTKHTAGISFCLSGECRFLRD